MSRKSVKGKIIEGVEITSLSSQGKGVSKIDSAVYFVENTYPGDILDISLRKKKSGYFEAVPEKWHEYSSMRIKPACTHFGLCGGCKTQDIDYQYQLLFKQKHVVDAIERIGKCRGFVSNPIIGSDKIYKYRNKIEYSFSSNKWLTKEEISSGQDFSNSFAAGFHIKGKFDKILDISDCLLQEEPSNNIRNYIKAYAIENNISFSNPKTNEGFIRSLFIRSTRLSEIMAILVVRNDNQPLIDDLLNSLIQNFPDITSLYYIINPKINDSLYDLNPVLFYGKEHILEKIGHIKLLVGPKSFLQTNSFQSDVLYQVVLQFAALQGHETVYDLYCGVGSIGLYLAPKSGKVIGIETVNEAIKDAELNKDLNQSNNSVFISGQVEDLFNMDFMEKYGKPDVIVLDPPRSGIHKSIIDKLIYSETPKIVYVSCNPATQARDILLLSQYYDLVEIQPVDMFPHTLHVENVALLKRK